MRQVKQYVIIGNGCAAAGCIEGIRAADPTGKITVVSREDHHVYCRPLISYYLEGKTDSERILYRPADFYEENGCSVLYGISAEKIDAKNKKVKLSDGGEVSYDELCIASGSDPFVPPMKGLDSVENKYTFMTLDDALSLEAAVTKDSRVLIIGAGLIGLKCAEGLLDRAGSITVCDLADRVLSSIMDEECAAAVQSHLEECGIKFMLGNTAESFEFSSALMKNGEKCEFDVLVLAIGVRPNISLAKDAGAVCGRAIDIDTHMRTSLENVYAAGDCTESVDVSDGSVKIMALMPNAYMQGRCAGENMAGGDKKFESAVPMNSIGFFGLYTMTAGSRSDTDEVYCEKSDDGKRIKKLFVRDGRLCGFMLVGAVERAGIYTNMIRNRTSLDDVDFEKMKKIPNLFAFSEEYRRNKLGGVV